ncbi:helix-turn-helix domain-containing protein [Siculibacillus lacustris]|uniref:Helix-turn-helix domain-containing protein n=1 Tax=Siculibacillus lacustris TaxID=1549641 RepID=A0A4Q9VXI8_9HYPH|nr:helix-turn-helix domain-containing protein [Siculibacillus lacustris]TBW41202.1 helix-turn-helix domain-containing protein [Siculibacillus lacustris]
MPAIAPAPLLPPRPRTVAAPAATIGVVAFPGINPFHLAVPGLVFGVDRGLGDTPRDRLLVGAAVPGRCPTSGGYALEIDHDFAALAACDMVIVPSWTDPDDEPDAALLDLLREAHGRGARIVGLCLGTFVVAAAGLLDGRAATTHWAAAEILAARHPAITVRPEVLYVDEGDVVTAAGVAAGLDCCLHLLRTRHGAEVANRVARRLVVSPHRQGGQAQFIEQPVRPGPEVDRFARVLDAVRARLDRPHSLDATAAAASMSRRSFVRHFRRATGTSFAAWLRHQRLTAAQRLLETTDRPIEAIAAAVGFGSAVSLREAFERSFGTSPSRWRATFASREPAGSGAERRTAVVETAHAAVQSNPRHSVATAKRMA